MNDFKNFTEKLKEHAVYDLDLSQFDDYFSDIKHDIKTLKNFSREMNILKDFFKDINVADIHLIKIDEENYQLDFGHKIQSQITSLKSYYAEIDRKNSILIEKINNDFYNGSTLRLDFEIEIESNNFNKMHFPINLPTNLKNISLGKKIFIRTIEKIGFTIFSSEDISIDAKLTIYSIVKNEKSLFSFIKDKNIITFSSLLNFNDIIKILFMWLELTEYDNLILDEDFFNVYKEKIKKNKKINSIYDIFFKKYY